MGKDSFIEAAVTLLSNITGKMIVKIEHTKPNGIEITPSSSCVALIF